MIRASRSQRGTNLPPDILEFLVGFAQALKKHAIYPPDHPALEPAARDVLQRLEGLFAGDRSQLTLVVSRDRIVVEAAASDRDHPLLSSMAARLHRHQLLSLTFSPGVTEDEIADLLNRTSVEVGQTDQPLGADLGGQPLWDHIEAQPVPYESLALSSGKEDEDAKDVWDPEFDAVLYEPWVEEAAGRVQDILKGADAELATKINQSISRLMGNLDKDTLRRLRQKLRGADLDSTLPFGMTPEMLAEAVVAFAENSEDAVNEEVNDLLLRVFMKFAMHSESLDLSRGSSDSDDLPPLVRQMSESWEVVNPNPTDYKDALDHFLTDTPVLEMRRKWVGRPDPERIVQMTIEIDQVGPPSELAVTTMIEERQLASLLDLLDGAPEGSNSSDELWKRVARPETIQRLLRDDQPDFAILDRLTARVGLPAAEPMLDALTESRSRAKRRNLFNRLSRMGPEIAPLVVSRARDERWFVRRNMLALLAELQSLPEDFSAGFYLHDTEPGVRREAVVLALRVPAEREEAILVALQDADERIMALGLSAAEESCPESALPLVISHVLDPELAPGARVCGIRALAESGSPNARKALLRLTLRRKWLVWKRLVSKSPVMLEALAGLNKSWPDHPDVQLVQQLAQRADDSQIRERARAEETSE